MSPEEFEVRCLLCLWLQWCSHGSPFFVFLVLLNYSQRTKRVCAKQLVDPPKKAADVASQVWSVLMKEQDYDFGMWHKQAEEVLALTKQVRRATLSHD